MTKYKPIGEITNYYGGVLVMKTESEGRFYWTVENYSTNLNEIDLLDWEEIDEEFYNALLAWEKRRKKQRNE